MNTFDIKRDNELINSGTHFWCETCLVAWPKDDQSPDPRYCLVCYDFLLKEVEMITSHAQKGAWIPRRTAIKAVGAVDSKEKGLPPIPRGGGGIMSQKKRGPKHQALPGDLIKQMAAGDLSSRTIAARLEEEHGFKVSYKTIQRVLSGQRVLV